MVLLFFTFQKCFPAENPNFLCRNNKSTKYFYTLAHEVTLNLWNCIKYIRSITLQSIV